MQGDRDPTVQQLRDELHAHRRRVLTVTADICLAMSLVALVVMAAFRRPGVEFVPVVGVVLACLGMGVAARRDRPSTAFALLVLGTMAAAGGAHVVHVESPLAVVYPVTLLIVGATLVSYERLPGLYAGVLAGTLLIRGIRGMRGLETLDTWTSITFDVSVILLVSGVFLYIDRQRTQRDRDQLERSLVWADGQRLHNAELQAEAQEAAAAARSANAAKSEFLARVSHELRTPLNAVLGYAELIQEDGDVDAVSREDLARIHGSATHLLGLVDDVLDLSRIDAGHLDLALEPVDLAQLVHGVAEVVQPVAMQNGNQLKVSCEPTTVCLDARRVRQVLLNLVSNASRFTTNGEVVLAAEVGERSIRLSVHDTGIGIDPDRVTLLFEPFTQATRETQHEYGGTGLGLALCDRLVRAMGGHIDVRTAPGQGSTFTVTLPRQPVA